MCIRADHILCLNKEGHLPHIQTSASVPVRENGVNHGPSKRTRYERSKKPDPPLLKGNHLATSREGTRRPGGLFSLIGEHHAGGASPCAGGHSASAAFSSSRHAEARILVFWDGMNRPRNWFESDGLRSRLVGYMTAWTGRSRYGPG